MSRKGGYASRWTSVALGDTNITVRLARELETAGPSAALFANPYYVCLRTFYVAPPPGGNDANDGARPQSPWATLTKASVGRVAGDCVNLAPGTYKLTAEVTITSGGNASNPPDTSFTAPPGWEQLLVDVAKSNFALKPGSPAIGFGTLQPYLPCQCIDVGACPSACTTCP